MDPDPKPQPPKSCDGCGQPIPAMAKLAAKQDGRTLCLACSIREAQVTKGLRH